MLTRSLSASVLQLSDTEREKYRAVGCSNPGPFVFRTIALKPPSYIDPHASILSRSSVYHLTAYILKYTVEAE